MKERSGAVGHRTSGSVASWELPTVGTALERFIYQRDALIIHVCTGCDVGSGESSHEFVEVKRHILLQ